MSTELKRAVGLFSDRQDAEAALVQLKDSGFDMDKVSVITKKPQTDEMQGATVSTPNDQNQPADAARKGAAIGGLGGGTVGLITSLSILAVPGVGPAAEVGILLANTLFGGAVGAAGGGLVGALVGWGLPEERAKYYNDRICNSGDYLILVEGDASTIQLAQTVLDNHRVRDWQTFSPSTAVPDRAPVYSERETFGVV